MHIRNRVCYFVSAICFFCIYVPLHAQPFHGHHCHGFRPSLPVYRHGHFHGSLLQIVVEPVYPLWMMPLADLGTLEPVFQPPMFQPPMFQPPVIQLPARMEIPSTEASHFQGLAQPPLATPLSDPGPFDELAEIRRRASVLKRSTPGGRDRADRLISSGDLSFGKQSYGRAVAQYRDAIARAPDYAAGHFRLAHAYVATQRYGLALKSALTALELAGTARRDGFTLGQLYRGNKLARERHDAALSDAALREPTDGGLQFLIGFTLHFDGQALKAREHFRSANQFPGAHQAYVRHFLPVVHVAEPNEFATNAD